MANKTAKIQSKQLYLPESDAPLCLLGSRAWFAWLETATTFRYFSSQRLLVAHTYYRALRPISLRKEKRRQTSLWYAYLRSHGCLHKRYVGKSIALTEARLDEIATVLNQQW